MNALLWLLLLPLVATPMVYFIGRAVEKVKPSALATTVHWAGLAAMIALWPPFLMASAQLLTGVPPVLSLGMVSLSYDGLSMLLTAVVLTLGTLVILYSGPQLVGKLGDEKYYASLIAMVGMIIGLGCANDLFNLWVWFEGMAVSSYLLVIFYRDRPTALEAGVKYLVQGAVGSILILLAIALVFAQTGQLDLHAIQRTALEPPIILAAGALFIIGFGVKMALVPLHTWLPDAHSQAPSGVSAMLSGVVIEAGLVALLRVLMALSGATASWAVLLLSFGALNMLAGNLLALPQKQVKRMLAYSSLSHRGYVLIGLGIGLYAGELAGASGGMFHFLNHGLMKGLAFLAAGALIYVMGDIDQEASQDTPHDSVQHHGLAIADMAGAARRYPLTAAVLSLALLGLGGIPPLAGFMSEWQIFVAGFATRSLLISGLVIFAALNSLLSLAYYIPIVNVAYRQEPSSAVTHGQSMPIAIRIPMVVLALAIVAIGIWPSLVTWLVEPAGRSVMAGFGM